LVDKLFEKKKLIFENEELKIKLGIKFDDVPRVELKLNDDK